MITPETVRREFHRAILGAFRTRFVGRGSILDWGRNYFPDYFTLNPGRHHVDIDANLQKWSKERGIRAVVEGPRGCAKSTFFTFLYPLWAACNGKEPYMILISDTYTQASKYLAGIQHELVTNERLAEDYPHVCGRGPQWNADGILTRNGIRIEPLGTGQKIRGRRKLNIRPTCIIVDDPEGDDAAYSAKTRETVRDWATKGVMKAGSPETNIFIAGTVIHRDCLVGHLSRLPGWRVLNYQSIAKWPDRMDLWGEWETILQDNSVKPERAEILAKAFYVRNKGEMDKGAEILWPELEDLYALMFMRATEGHNAFEAEKQNNPVDPSKCEWSPHLLEGDEVWFEDWPAEVIASVVALDPSKGKQDKSGDYQAIVRVDVGADANLYVDADISRRPLTDMVEAFVDYQAMWQPHVAVVEDVQFQELLLPEIESAAAESKLVVPLEGISTEGVNKIARIRRLGPYVSRRRIKFKRRSPGAELLRRQLMDVPNGDFDDGPDAMEMAVRRAVQLLADVDREESGGVVSPL
jgi:predicted phage terminase large subunit-like protein